MEDYDKSMKFIFGVKSFSLEVVLPVIISGGFGFYSFFLENDYNNKIELFKILADSLSVTMISALIIKVISGHFGLFRRIILYLCGIIYLPAYFICRSTWNFTSLNVLVIFFIISVIGYAIISFNCDINGSSVNAFLARKESKK